MMKINIRKTKYCLLALLMACCSMVIYGQTKNPSQKLYIESDQATIDQLNNFALFTGDVILKQGSTRLTADRLSAYTDKNQQLTLLVAQSLGKKLALYQTKPAADKPILNAKAKIIKYYPQQNYVLFIQQAQITQGKNAISGPQLKYNTQKQFLSSINTQNTSAGRTKIVIEPNT